MLTVWQVKVATPKRGRYRQQSNSHQYRIDVVITKDVNYFPLRRDESICPRRVDGLSRGGRFFVSLLKRKRPASTQPFIPGSQERSLTC